MTERRITNVGIDDDYLTVHIDDGRVLATPLAWYPRLLDAGAEERAAWELIGDGHGISWPELDEDLSLDGMLRGQPAGRRVHRQAAE